MPESLWSDAFCEERNEKGIITVKPVTKVILFLYLMTRGCSYAYDIASEFKNAINHKKWTEEIGLTDLKLSSKVSSALNSMAERHLLISRDELEKRYPAFKWTHEKKGHERQERRYFSINPDVILSPVEITIPSRRRTEIIKWLNDFYGTSELPEKKQSDENKIIPLITNQPAEKILWESKTDIELLMSYVWYSNDSSNSTWLTPQFKLFQTYNQYLATIRLFENYTADPLDMIEYINRISTKDYLTILVTADMLANEVSRAYQKMQDTQREPKVISAEVKKENLIFSDLKRLKNAWNKTVKEINLPYKNKDPMAYIIPTDIVGYSTLLNNAISYSIQQERKVRIPPAISDPVRTSGKQINSPKQSKSRHSGKKSEKKNEY